MNISTRIAEISWLNQEKGIIFSKAKKGVEINVDDARESMEALANFDHPSRRMIVDISEIKNQTAEARAYYSSKESTDYVKSMALLTGSKFSIGNIIGNFFIGLNKGDIPTKLFYNLEDAITWTESLIQEEN